MSAPAHDPEPRARRRARRPDALGEPPRPRATHPAAMALALQRTAGNRSVARLISGRAPAGAAAVLHRLPATAPAPAEADLVRRWIAAGETRENVLSDRLFFHRHPDLAGTRLTPGGAEAREWLEVRQAVVRPALASPVAPAAAPAPADATTAGDGEATAASMVGDALTAIGDAVGSAVSAGEDLLQDVADAGGALLDFASEGGAVVGGAVLDLLGIGSHEEEVPDDLQQPEVVVEVPLEAEPRHERGDAYKSQRDNASAHVGGDASCSPTSFTMALIDLHGGDEQLVRSRTVELISERGGRTDYEQTEELVIELLEIVDWEAATAEKPAYFWSPSTWAAWATRKYGGHYYKDPNAQQYVASLFPGTGGEAAETYSEAYTRDAWAPVVRALADGAYATAQGAFTSSGHVVDIVDADDDGVVINDPFGLWLRAGAGYGLPNGSPGGRLTAAAKAEFDRRARRNPALADVYDGYGSDTPPAGGYDAWGERNFYAWADVEDVRLGKWISVLRSA